MNRQQRKAQAATVAHLYKLQARYAALGLVEADRHDFAAMDQDELAAAVEDMAAQAQASGEASERREADARKRRTALRVVK